MQQDKGQPPAGFFSVKPGVAIPKGTSVLFFDSFSWRSGLVLQPANGDSVTIIQDGPIAGRQLQLPRDKVLVHLEQATDLEKGLGLDGPPNMKYDLVLEKSNVFATHVLVDALKMEHREAMSFNNLAEPEVVKSDLELRQARAIQIKLTAAGATASIRPKK
jgi:hypothetical protein